MVSDLAFRADVKIHREVFPESHELVLIEIGIASEIETIGEDADNDPFFDPDPDFDFDEQRQRRVALSGSARPGSTAAMHCACPRARTARA